MPYIYAKYNSFWIYKKANILYLNTWKYHIIESLQMLLKTKY